MQVHAYAHPKALAAPEISASPKESSRDTNGPAIEYFIPAFNPRGISISTISANNNAAAPLTHCEHQ
jgi:hypothetical protein